MDHNWEPHNNWNGPPRQDWRQMDMPHPPLPPPPQFDFSSFNIPRGPHEGHSPRHHPPHFRSPMEGCDYDDNFAPDQRKRRMPYRGPAPHRNPAPGPLGLTGPWQEGGGGPRPPVFNRRGRGGFNRGFGHSNRPPFPGNNGPPPPMMDFPKTRKPSPYNMSVNPEGIVDVGAAKRKLLESVLQDKDKALPKDLLDKFSPLKCDLCNAKMNSNSMAKLHYSGKNHEKKVRLYMNNLNGGEAVSSAPKKAKLEPKSSPPKPMLITANIQLDESSAAEKEKLIVVDSSAVIESQKMECLSCNVSFTSPVQASQHFMSKNHARKLKGLDPKNAKYYNMDTGEWQAKPVPLLPEDKTGRFGIGEEFLKQPDALPDVFGGAVTKLPEINKSLKVYCDVCDCYTTSQEQMQTHLKGSRHQKKWAAKQKTQAHLPQGIFLEEPAPVLAPSDAILPPATKDQKKGAKKAGESSDLSNFRTPSGLYYCSICNISVNSESQFKTHSESKKHKAKSSTAKVPEPPAATKNDSWKPTLVKEEEGGTSSSFGLVPDNTEFTSD